MDVVVNWFALLIVFVFDPLAVSLVIGYNVLHRGDRYTNAKKSYKIYDEDEKDSTTEKPDDEKFLEEKDDDTKKLIEQLVSDIINNPSDEIYFDDDIDEYLDKHVDDVLSLLDENETVLPPPTGSTGSSGLARDMPRK